MADPQYFSLQSTCPGHVSDCHPGALVTTLPSAGRRQGSSQLPQLISFLSVVARTWLICCLSKSSWSPSSSPSSPSRFFWMASYITLNKSKYTKDQEANNSALPPNRRKEFHSCQFLFHWDTESVRVSRPLWRLRFRAHCWRRTCIGLDGCCFIFSEESDLFLQFVLLPLSEMIKGRHGHAKDSVELLWWEVTLGGERRRQFRDDKSMYLLAYRLQIASSKYSCLFQKWFSSTLLDMALWIKILAYLYFPYTLICPYNTVIEVDFVKESWSSLPPVWLGPHHLEDVAVLWLILLGLHMGRSNTHRDINIINFLQQNAPLRLWPTYELHFKD